MGSQPQPGGSGVPFGDALTAIVNGLKDPYLLFGLGAGIILVGALTLTGNTVLILIVAAVLVIALVVRLIANVQSQPGGGGGGGAGTGIVAINKPWIGWFARIGPRSNQGIQINTTQAGEPTQKQGGTGKNGDDSSSGS